MGRSILGQWGSPSEYRASGSFFFFFLLGGGSQLTTALVNNGSAENWDASLRNTADYLLLLLKLWLFSYYFIWSFALPIISFLQGNCGYVIVYQGLRIGGRRHRYRT